MRRRVLRKGCDPRRKIAAVRQRKSSTFTQPPTLDVELHIGREALECACEPAEVRHALVANQDEVAPVLPYFFGRTSGRRAATNLIGQNDAAHNSGWRALAVLVITRIRTHERIPRNSASFRVVRLLREPSAKGPEAGAALLSLGLILQRYARSACVLERQHASARHV